MWPLLSPCRVWEPITTQSTDSHLLTGHALLTHPGEPSKYPPTAKHSKALSQRQEASLLTTEKHESCAWCCKSLWRVLTLYAPKQLPASMPTRTGMPLKSSPWLASTAPSGFHPVGSATCLTLPLLGQCSPGFPVVHPLLSP